MTRFRRSLSGNLLLKGAVATAVVLGAATQLATLAAADDGDWWRHHRFAEHDRYWDHGRIYVHPGPRYYYAPPPAYYPPPPPPAYYYGPPAPSFSFGLRVH